MGGERRGDEIRAEDGREGEEGGRRRAREEESARGARRTHGRGFSHRYSRAGGARSRAWARSTLRPAEGGSPVQEAAGDVAQKGGPRRALAGGAQHACMLTQAWGVIKCVRSIHRAAPECARAEPWQTLMEVLREAYGGWDDVPGLGD